MSGRCFKRVWKVALFLGKCSRWLCWGQNWHATNVFSSFCWESTLDDRIDMPPTWPSLTGENLIAAAVLDVLKPGPQKKHVNINVYLQMIAQLGKSLEFIWNDFELGSKRRGFRSNGKVWWEFSFLKDELALLKHWASSLGGLKSFQGRRWVGLPPSVKTW